MTDFAEQSLPRRHFLRGAFLRSLHTEQSQRQGQQAIRPPWAELAHFEDKCTACQACIQACEHEMQILVRGAGGLPEVDFSRGRGECSFCQACVQACDAGVFRDVQERPWTHQVSIQAHCLTQQRIACRSCEDSCSTRAIRFRPQLGGIATPQLTESLCNGCGACLNTCPSAAITLTSITQP